VADATDTFWRSITKDNITTWYGKTTRRGYEVWLRRIIRQWGTCLLTEVQARPIELWLVSLTLAPKSKAELRGLLRIIWDFAMWKGDIPTQRNPMELVTVKDATKRMRQPRSLTVEEFQKFIEHLEGPFRVAALLCVCLGLRISECLALKWADVDWLDAKLRVERGIIRQRVSEVKTIGSRKNITVNAKLLTALQAWKQSTQFSSADDWIFASPSRAGRNPWCYDEVLRRFATAGIAAGIGKLGTHSMRHTYRSWLDAVGTPIAVQQKLMRHADIRTTMNVYGDIVTDEMSQANSKVAGLALNGR
jgi:integrase